MKFFKASIFTFLLSSLISCNTSESKNVIVPEAKTTAITAEKEKLQILLKQLYEWHETKSSNNDFNPIADTKDSSYIGLNLKEHAERIKEFKKTNFFSNNFLENYDKMGLKIDKELKNGQLEWAVGELPPFGNGTNPWCNCQDNPENYWKTLTIKKINIDDNTANLTWTWGDDFEYNVKAIKDNNSWKIDYLEGFDSKNYFPQ